MSTRRKIFITLMIGCGVGSCYAIQDTLGGGDVYRISAAFCHWLGMTIYISYSTMKLKGWVKGLVMGEISASATSIMAFITVSLQGKSGIEAIIVIFVSYALSGIIAGFLTEKFAK